MRKNAASSSYPHTGPGEVEWQYLELPFDDVTVELSVRLPKRADLETDLAGLVVRRDESDAFYFFAINNGSGWSFGKRLPDASERWQFLRRDVDAAIQPGDAPNRLRVSVRGGRFDLYVNDRHLETVSDRSLPGPGHVGVIAISPNHVVFDDLEVKPAP